MSSLNARTRSSAEETFVTAELIPVFPDKVPHDILKRVEHLRFAERIASLVYSGDVSGLVKELRLIALSLDVPKPKEESRLDMAFEILVQICPQVETCREQISSGIWLWRGKGLQEK